VTEPSLLPRRAAVSIFLCFAFAYFFSALVRAVTATLAPTFSAELGLRAGDLGLLAGAFFFGFAAMQLPLGGALDRFGPRRVLLVLLAIAVLGNIAFALARSFGSLIAARTAIGIGVSACLMAPMTAYRLLLTPHAQMRATSWMLMTGSFGMVASTLPVQWLLPQLGWRGLFWVLAAGLALSMVLVAQVVPRDRPMRVASMEDAGGYLRVFRHPTFVRFAPLGFFQYGGLLAVQALWAGPWLTDVCGWTSAQAARGLFAINLSMLLTFFAWGIVVPRLYARGATAHHLIRAGLPLSFVALGAALALGPAATAWLWALFCVSCTFVSLSQPAIGLAFPTALAGRALSAYNFVIFVGVFAVQWGIGLLIDALRARGFDTVAAYRGAFGVFAAACVLSYLWFVWRTDSAPRTTVAPSGAECR
jgi:predicted MFS family arabinose efflux permease